MTVAAHPSRLTGGISDDQCKVRNVLGHHRPGADKGVTANRYTAHNRRIRADRAPAL